MNLHANCVAIDGTGVLLVGPSGSGKSGLTLQLMALGATLVSDDRTELSLYRGQLVAQAPKTIAGLIEARGIGILHATHQDTVTVKLVVDLERTETERLPLPHHKEIMTIRLPCLHKVDAPHFPAAILQYVLAGPRVAK